MEALLASPLEIHGILYTEAATADERAATCLSQARERGIQLLPLSDSEMESASDTESPQGVLAVARVPVFAIPEPHSGFRMIVLDAVQDPGNAGTILRTAAALGVTHTVALPGTVDLWNAKVVRSAMGASFTHPTSSATWPELESWLRSYGIPLWVSDADGEQFTRADAVPDRLALAVGNEGSGLSRGIMESAERVVSIPMSADVESLNVAVATGILLYALSIPRS